MTVTRCCPLHPKYTAQEKPRCACENCWGMWAMYHPEAVGVFLAEMYARCSGTEVQKTSPVRARHGRVVGGR